MKTFQQFQEDSNKLLENYTIKDRKGNNVTVPLDKISATQDPSIAPAVGKYMNVFKNRIKPIMRADSFRNIFTKNQKPTDRVFSAVGVAAPYAAPIAKSLFTAPKTDVFNKSVRFVGRLNNKVPFLPKSTTKDFNPNQDIGKRASDFIGNKINKIFQRRNQNMGANELKGSRSGMG